MNRVISGLLIVIVLSACSTSPFPKITKMRSLSAPIVVSESADVSGNIAGLERSSTGRDGKIQANVLVVHGMGWSQQEKPDEVGFDLVKAIEAAYGAHGAARQYTHLCPRSKSDGSTDKRPVAGGLTITSNGTSLQTDSPLTSLNNKAVACLDKVVIDLGAKGTVNVYRLFWDDHFYNGYEYAHLGYDDGILLGQEATSPSHRGYENIHAQRASLNARLKTSLVTYGFSDATMYLGPVGERLRTAIAGGVCAVVNDLTGQARYFEPMHTAGPVGRSGNRAFTSTELCAVRGTAVPQPLTIITKSLGSRVLFDILTSERTPALASKLDLISNDELEVFMFANQIPLLGVGRLAQPKNKAAPWAKKLKFIAVSEINDVLTYELVPYFEHLYYLRCNREIAAVMDAKDKCTVENFAGRMDTLRTNVSARQTYIQELGFEVIDVRAKFAANVVPLIPFAHPLVAHGGHLGAKPVRDLFLCGADGGVLRTASCAAR
ncbi:MAG: hypothetical protein WKG03_02255 [Telluria sp.]